MVKDKEKRSPARPRWEMFLELLYHEFGGKKMDEQALEKELNDEILRRAKIMTQISETRSELDRLENEKSDSALKISEIRYQLYEREEDTK